VEKAPNDDLTDELERLKLTVENQRYEIKLLTQALEETEKIKEYKLPEFPVKESESTENTGESSIEPKRKEYETLLKDFQYLLKELSDTKAQLNKLREENIKKEQEIKKKEVDINNSLKDRDLMRIVTSLRLF
jgi:ribonuclease D